MRVAHGVIFQQAPFLQHQQQARGVARGVPAIVIVLVVEARKSALATRLLVPITGPMRRSNQITAFCTAARSAAADARPAAMIRVRALRRRREIEHFAAPADEAVADRHALADGGKIDTAL